MSTEPSRAILMLAAGLTLAGCSSATPAPDIRRFSEIGAPRPPPRTFPAASPTGRNEPVLPVTLGQAQARVAAYLNRAGFRLEAQPEADGALLTATRMGPPAGLDGQAACALAALRRPAMASTELTVRLRPAPGGVRLQAQARFVEVDTRLISGDLARETCRSRGALEAAVEGAALDGG